MPGKIKGAANMEKAIIKRTRGGNFDLFLPSVDGIRIRAGQFQSYMEAVNYAKDKGHIGGFE